MTAHTQTLVAAIVMVAAVSACLGVVAGYLMRPRRGRDGGEW